MKRKLVVLLQLTCLFLASLSLIAGLRHYGLGSTSDRGRIKGLGHEWPFFSGHASNYSTGKQALGWSEIFGQSHNLQGNIEDESLPPSQKDWNGATAFTAKPFLEQKIKFRSRFNTECYQGEPKLFAKDMWYHGYGKIAVVPSVNLEYTNEAAKKIKSAKGYVSQWTERDGQNDMPVKIAWESAPPPLVKRMPSYSNQTWPPWDEGLKEKGIIP